MGESTPAHILVVEDSALVASAMRILLEDAGHRVSEAASVREAVAVAAADSHIDLMLLDLKLADGDGLSVLAQLREREREPKIAIAITGYDDPVERERALAAGCRDVLLKPVPARELPRLVAHWLGA